MYSNVGLHHTQNARRNRAGRDVGAVVNSFLYKEKQGDIIEKYSDGSERVRFNTVAPKSSPKYITYLTELWCDCLKDRWVPSLIALAAFNLDFLCIHPFRDGNGRVSRLLLLLQLYQEGYEVGRYISLERLIEEHKERYYETLEISSQGWHKNKHDPWPYINFILYVLKMAYSEFVERVEKNGIARGGKTELVITAVKKFKSEFTLSQLQGKCPEVSRDMIRKVLRDLKRDGQVVSKGRGLAARWYNKG